MESVKQVGLFLKPMAVVLPHATGRSALWPDDLSRQFYVFLYTHIYIGFYPWTAKHRALLAAPLAV